MNDVSGYFFTLSLNLIMRRASNIKPTIIMNLRLIIIYIILVVSCVSASAQKPSVTGTVVDASNDSVLFRATVQLLKSDTTFVGGVLTDSRGRFDIRTDAPGKYILKVSNMGYTERMHDVTVSAGRNTDAGKIMLEQSVTLLGEAVVTANVPKMVVKEDTFVYNASAYRVAEGSVIEELVKKLPGAKIEEDGSITINGKQVTRLLLDGREFMGGDVQTGLKNLPADIVDKIKSYDEKSDLAKLTGIDDGNEVTVLDFGVKKEMKKGFNVNTNVGYGSHDRYRGRFMGARFYGDLRYTLIGNMNNMSNGGKTHTKMTGLNISYEKRDKLKIDGGVRWNHSNSDNWSKSSTESFVNKTGAFSNSVNQNYSRSDGWNANMRLEWKPDTMTNINFRPSFNYSVNDGRGFSSSASYKEDPFIYTDDPLGDDGIGVMEDNGLMVNRRRNKSLSNGSNWSAGASLQFFRKLNGKGRNIALNGSVNYGKGDSKSMSASNVHLYQVQDIYGNDSTYQTNRYNVAPSDNLNYSLRATYTEPLLKNVFLQMSYEYRYSHSVSDRRTYNFERIAEEAWNDVMNGYRDWDSMLGLFDQPLEYYLDDELSRYAEHNNYNHNINVQLRVVDEKYNLNAGIVVRPQRSHLVQDYWGQLVDTVRTVTNISPTLNFRYRFSKYSDLRLTYRGSTSQPSITSMLDITDDSNPLYISKGNPGLKPSFTSNINMEYKTHSVKRHRTINAGAWFSTTSNSISNMVTYDEKTGARTTQPCNINGNWNGSLRFGYNTSIDTADVWTVGADTRLNYRHLVSYINLNNSAVSEKNVTHSTSVHENIRGNYRSDWLDVGVHASVTYDRTRNMLQENNNMDTWRYSYGMDVGINAPWGMSLWTDINQNSRRGYNEKSMNTDELIWNLQISQSFLKKKELRLMLEFRDILREQSHFSRSINANSRNDTEYNSINSYVMLRVQYRMNMFGGRKSGRRTRG